MTVGGTDLFVIRCAVASPCITQRLLEKQISATLIILSSLCASLFITTHSDQPSVDDRKKMQVPKKAIHKTMIHEYVLLEASEVMMAQQPEALCVTAPTAWSVRRRWIVCWHSVDLQGCRVSEKYTHTHTHTVHCAVIVLIWPALPHNPQSEFLLFHK